jgi:hypothetical protein
MQRRKDLKGYPYQVASERRRLQLDIDKCEFHVRRIKYLGLIITAEGVTMDPGKIAKIAKIAAITDWQTPTSVKDIQQFVGFCGFYRRFRGSLFDT